MSSGASPGRATDRLHRWIADAVAGISVALVIVPQGMAYAELAGLPPHHGLYASALPPLLAAFFASSPYLQTGPVALTSLLSFGALSTLGVPIGGPEYVAAAALLALVVGVVRVAIGVTGAGSVAYLMSQPVLRGFTLAAAILIVSSQLPSVLGVVPEEPSVLLRAGAALASPHGWSVAALGLSALTVVAMIGGRRLHPLFPGVLLAVVVGVVFSLLTAYPGATVGSVPAVLLPPLNVDLPWWRLPQLAVSGAIIALVGFAEAASVAQAYAEEGRQPWDPSREFVGQGVANLAAGLTAGFPVGGSFSRSAINRLAGAQTRASGGITGLVVVLFLPFAFLLSPLPKAVLGAIVVGAVSGLLNPRPLLSLFRQSVLQGVIGTATFVATLASAPNVEYGVMIGIVVAVVVHLYREQHLDVEVVVEGQGRIVFRPHGVLWFGSAPVFRQRVTREVARHPNVRVVVLDLGAVGRVDLTGALALRDIAAHGGDALAFELRNVPVHARRVLAKVLPDQLPDA
ncbi:MAG: SulP family inorganic anion transporter [Sandaracinaceae bacterium]